MSPYILTLIVFSVLLGIVWIVVSMWKTVYLPNMSETTNAQEDVETRKEKANKIRSRRFVFGIGGVVVLCMLTMLGIWLSSPVKKVYAALNPSSTPTITNTPTATATRTPTRTPRNSPTPRSDISHTAGGPTVTGTPPTATRTKTLAPSGSGSGGGSVIVQTRIVSVIQTKLVDVTRIVIHTVIVTVTNTGSVTPSSTPTVTSTVTETGTPTATATVTSTPTETETPTP